MVPVAKPLAIYESVNESQVGREMMAYIVVNLVPSLAASVHALF